MTTRYEDMCNIVSEVLLELEKPSTVSEIASKARENEGVVRHALITLEKTGFVKQKDGRWLISGSQEDDDQNTYPKVYEQERELNITEARSKPPERGTDQTVSSVADQLGNLELRSRTPKRGAASSEKSSPEDKLPSRLVVQNENSVVPYMNRSISNPHVSTVGSSNLEIETRQTIQAAVLSDPDEQELHGNFKSILTYLESKPGGATALEVSRNCNLGNSKKAANKLLFFLEKKQLVCSKCIGDTQKKNWKIGPNIKKVSEQQLVEFAAERKKESGGSSAAAKSGTEIHLHNHLHKHEHTNYIQVGDHNTMVTPQVLEEHERRFERSAEDEVE